MFKLQDNVPEVYVDQSRDFQLFTRLYDAVFGGVKYSIDSLQHSTNTIDCNEKLLSLLKYKLGFFSEIELDTEGLRLLLASFLYIIRYKGSKKALLYILYLFNRISKIQNQQYNLRIINDPEVASLNNDHLLHIQLSSDLYSNKLLLELLQLVLPTGYQLSYSIQGINTLSSKLQLISNIEIYKVKDASVIDDFISPEEFDLSSNDADDLTSAIGITEIEIRPSFNPKEEINLDHEFDL